jgi:hypothetical protein
MNITAMHLQVQVERSRRLLISRDRVCGERATTGREGAAILRPEQRPPKRARALIRFPTKSQMVADPRPESLIVCCQ